MKSPASKPSTPGSHGRRNRATIALGVSAAALLVAALLATVVVRTVPFAGLAWVSLSGSQSLAVARSMREALLEQPRFVAMLRAHERQTLRRYRSSGARSLERRHVVRVPLGRFGLPGLHDVFAVQVRTDVVGGRPLTSFLVGLGIDPRRGEERFFQRQCGGSGLCEGVVGAMVGGVTGLHRLGLLKTCYVSVTESDETSRVAPKRLAVREWSQASARMHRARRGRQFGQ